MWKVPRRSIYCDTFMSWLKEVCWVFFVIKVWPHATDLGSDPLMPMYLEKPETFIEQYWWRIRELNGLPAHEVGPEGA